MSEPQSDGLGWRRWESGKRRIFLVSVLLEGGDSSSGAEVVVVKTRVLTILCQRGESSKGIWRDVEQRVYSAHPEGSYLESPSAVERLVGSRLLPSLVLTFDEDCLDKKTKVRQQLKVTT